MALTDDLISYWKLDEASGNALDAHGSNTLTDTNTVGAATGKISGGRDFESSASEYFTIADNASLSTGDIDFTFSLWVNAESLAANADIISKDTATSPNREYIIGFASATPRFRFILFDGASATILSANNLGAPSTGTWYFIVAWHDSVNNTMNIQVNNGAVDSVSHTTGTDDGAAPFRIGARGNTAEFFDGIVDEVGFWKRVLTSDERASLYNSGNGLAYPFTSGTTVARLVNDAPYPFRRPIMVAA